jgi:hypothetical protein
MLVMMKSSLAKTQLADHSGKLVLEPVFPPVVCYQNKNNAA